jgi:hypothetical protein
LDVEKVFLMLRDSFAEDGDGERVMGEESKPAIA